MQDESEDVYVVQVLLATGKPAQMVRAFTLPGGGAVSTDNLVEDVMQMRLEGCVSSSGLCLLALARLAAGRTCKSGVVAPSS